MRSGVLLVPHGPPAVGALGEALAGLRGGDPLAPATVVVRDPRHGVALRRELARGPGVANVRFTTLDGVAEWIAGPRLGELGRRAVPAVLAAVLHAVLVDEPGELAPVADHPATEAALGRALGELRPLGAAALAAVGRSGRRAADVVRVHGAVRRRLEGWYDDHDVMAHATAMAGAPTVAAAGRLTELGPLVLHLPDRLGAAALRFVGALASSRPMRAVLGLTGDARTDEATAAWAADLGAVVGPVVRGSPPRPRPVQVLSGADAGGEVTAALGALLERAAAGVPLHRMAVLYPGAEPYAAVLADRLDAAGLPWNGAPRRTLAETMSGAVLLGLLGLADGRLRRDAVVDWLSSAPIVADEASDALVPAAVVPAARWDVLSQRAGVVGGLDEWERRLAHLARTARAQADRLADDPDAERAVRHLRFGAEEAAALARFVGELAGRLDPGGPAGWAGFVGWVERLLDRYLGPARRADGWPPAERAARTEVVERLRTLALLDELGPGGVPCDPRALHRALARELAGPAPADRSFGDGLFVGPLAGAVGLPFDAVAVVGAVDGVLPPRWRDDPLLPEAARDGAAGLRSGRERARERAHAFFAVTSGAPHVVASWPRTDRDGRPTSPSRLLGLPATEARDPRHGAAATPVSLLDLRVGELTRAHRARRLDRHPHVVDDGMLRQALAIRRARRRGRFDRFEGRVGPASVESPAGGPELSPTSLEVYAACPRRYLFEKVLAIEALERPEEILELSAIHRGSLVHEVLERFVRDSPPPSRPDEPWGPDAPERMGALLDAVGAEYEQLGLTGRPLLWRLARRRILRDLEEFLRADVALRRAHGVVPAPDGLELGFGLWGDDGPAVSFPLPDGQPVRFRGRIDRVDRSPDGERVVVIDYKTGSRRGNERIRERLERGTKLQLPVYGLAARQRYQAREVVALYWFVGRRERFHREELHLDDGALEAFGRSVRILVEGISSGSFPARPGRPDQSSFEHCAFCAYDTACSPHRAHTWERIRTDPALGAYVGLVEPEALVDQLVLPVATDG
jgi:RecB family exonuclease